jgi:hypothetical protein
MSEQSIGPGWYPNPSGPGNRYWDGNQWTNAVTTPGGGVPWQGGSFAVSATFPRTETSLYAILAIVFPFVFPPLGVVFGIMGLREINRSDGQKTGRGLAIAGIWCGAIFTVLSIAWFIFVLSMMASFPPDPPMGY